MAFDPINLASVDLLNRAVQRTLLQFRHSPVLQSILAAFISEVTALEIAAEGTITGRSPLDAVDVQLDGLGRIVGQDRIVFDYSLIEYFAPDVVGQAVDGAPAWVANAPTSENFIVGDAWYRQLIEARVARNFAKYGSVCENKEMAKLAFGVSVGFVRTGIMQVDVIAPSGTPNYVLNFLTAFNNTTNSDGVSFMPYPQTLEVNNAILIPEQPFAPDTVNGADVGKAAIGYIY